MQRDRFVTRRRIALAVIALLIVVPVYMLFIRDGDGGGPSQSDLAAAVNDPDKARQVLVGDVGDHEQGITIRFPATWTGMTKNRAVRAKSGNGRTVVVVTTGGRADQAPAIFKRAVKGIASSYAKPKITFIPAKKQPRVGGLPAAGAAVDGRLKGGQGAASLVYVARGKHRAYIVTAIVPSDGGELNAADLVLTRGLTLSD